MTVDMISNFSFDEDSVFEMCNKSNYAKLLGLKVIEVSSGKARVAMELDERLVNPTNFAHGGAILSLADHTCGTAALTLGMCIGGQFSVNFLSSPKNGETVFADANVIHNGRRTRVIDVEIKNQDDKMIAKGTAVAIVLDKID